MLVCPFFAHKKIPSLGGRVEEESEKKVYISTVKLQVFISCNYFSINMWPFRDPFMKKMLSLIMGNLPIYFSTRNRPKQLS